MPIIPPPVDDNGNITVPAEGGVVIPVKEQDSQDPPQRVDLSSIPLKFMVKNRLSIVLTSDPDDVLGKLLVLTESDADQISAKGHEFQLLDMSVPLVPIVLWSGIIKRGT